MQIEIAKTAGFCMGVRRAVQLTLGEVEKKDGSVYTYGPLIHNPQVLDLFAKKKIIVIEHLPDKNRGTIIIRAHGISPNIEKKLRLSNFKIIDATCPRVTKVQRIIKINSNRGCATIIIGDKNHPEVLGLIGYAKSDVHVVCNMLELQLLPFFKKAIVVAQTTQNVKFYKKVRKWIFKKNPHYYIFDTICDSTERRQIETKLLASSVDLIIVVGGKQSGNTNRLREVAEKYGKQIIHIETELELYSHNILPFIERIGITAGASTPRWIINKVYNTIQYILSKR